MKSKTKEYIIAYLLIAPNTVGVVFFVLLPILMAIRLSLYSQEGFTLGQFIGLGNYRNLFGDVIWWNSMKVTFLYTGMLLPLLFLGSLGLAVLANTRFLKFQKPFRTACFSPYMLSMISVAVVWMALLNPSRGLLNRVLSRVGIAPSQWLASVHTALPSIVLINVWWYVGYYMIIFLGGLQDIPQEYYEAARIDGAGGWKAFWFITLPLLKPTMAFIAVMLTIVSFNVFDIVYVMTSGGPARATHVAALFIFRQGFEFLRFSYASASAVVLGAMMLVFAIVQLRFLKTTYT